MAIKLTTEIEDYIRLHYPTEGSKPILEKYGMPQSTLAGWIKKLGIIMSKETKSHLATLRNSRKAEEYDIDVKQFVSVETPEVAYLLGFIWADGHVRCITPHQGRVNVFNISSDIKEIEWIFRKTGNWRFHYVPNTCPTYQPQTRVITSNCHLANYLASKDYLIKTNRSACSILSMIPDHLKHYWWRGYFDGDGCIYQHKTLRQVSLTSAYGQDWTFVKKLFDSLGVKHVIIQRTTKEKHKNSVVRLTGHDSCISFMTYIYQGREQDGIGLSRKYQRYLFMQEHVPKKKKSCTYMGVGFSKYAKKWRAMVTPNATNQLKIIKYIGFFSTPEEARAARAQYMKERGWVDRVYFGDKIYTAEPIV